MYERALQGLEKVLGPDHTSTLDTAYNLASLYSNQGRLADAEALYERALHGFQHALGPSHQKGQVALQNLQSLQQIQGMPYSRKRICILF